MKNEKNVVGLYPRVSTEDQAREVLVCRNFKKIIFPTF